MARTARSSFPGPVRHAHPWVHGPALPAAPELRTIGLVCQSRPVPGAVRRISRSEPTGCDGRHAGREKRTVLATPRHCEDRHADARSRRSWVWGSAWDRGPDARERRLASLCFRANPSHQPAGMIRFSTEANPHTGSQGFCRFRGTVPLSSPRGPGAAGRWSL